MHSGLSGLNPGKRQRVQTRRPQAKGKRADMPQRFALCLSPRIFIARRFVSECDAGTGWYGNFPYQPNNDWAVFDTQTDIHVYPISIYPEVNARQAPRVPVLPTCSPSACRVGANKSATQPPRMSKPNRLLAHVKPPLKAIKTIAICSFTSARQHKTNTSNENYSHIMLSHPS